LSVFLRFLHSLHFAGQQILTSLHAGSVTPVILARDGDDQWLLSVRDCLSVCGNGGTCVGVEP
jgi:hypothetical protein